MNIEEKTKLAQKFAEIYLKAWCDDKVEFDDTEHLAVSSFLIVDEIEAEAEKRIKAGAKEKREAVRKLLNDDGTFLEKEGQHFEDLNMADSPQLEWQPDWSQAPEWADWWAIDKDLVSFWHEDKPKFDKVEFYQCGVFCDAPLFNYRGDWKDSLRKRPK